MYSEMTCSGTSEQPWRVCGQCWVEVGSGSRCTLHVQRGRALVHGEHVGAGAHVGARVARLHVADGQDAVEVHGSGGQLPVVQAGPYQGVGGGLQGQRRV